MLAAVALLAGACAPAQGAARAATTPPTAVRSPTTAIAAAPVPTATRPAPTPLPALTATPRPAVTATRSTATGGPVVDAGDDYFDLALLEVPVGTTVTWRTSGTKPHDVVARNGAFDSRPMTTGQTFSFRFTTPGRYPYVCSIHEGQGMFGEVVVK